MRELVQLAEFISTIDLDRLPPEVITRAKWVIRDTIGVILGGLQEQEMRALADFACQRHPGQVSILGSGGRVSPAWAALVHGAAGTSLEMDEGHAFARGHAAIHALPPALAFAQQNQRGGREVLTAFIIGYEVAARTGVATSLRKSVHPFGAWGVLGAAAIAAWHQGFGPADIAGALELAASYAITPSFATAIQGATVRNTYAGVVNYLGILAAEIYQMGFRGETGGLATTFGEILGEGFDTVALTDGLGEHYEILRGYFKPYSACRYTHAAVDATLGLLANGEIIPGKIETIEVATYAPAAGLNDAAPKNPLAGRFSLPFVVAATLITGGAGPEIFSPDVLEDATVLDLASRVKVREDTRFTAMTPAKRPAQVIIHFVDGSSLENTVAGSKGDPDLPMTPDELVDKYHHLADPVIGREQARRAWDRIGVLEDNKMIGPLLADLTTSC